jgi:hypothetical protein
MTYRELRDALNQLNKEGFDFDAEIEVKAGSADEATIEEVRRDGTFVIVLYYSNDE